MGEVGQEVKRQREARGWTQAKLAVEAGMAPSAVNQIENGKRSPSATSLSKLARALEMEVRDLFPLGQPRLPDLEEQSRAHTERMSQLADELMARAAARIEGAGALEETFKQRMEYPGALEAALEAARRQDTHDTQAAYRAVESGRVQLSSLRHEKDAVAYLMQLDKVELASALLNAASMVVALKTRSARGAETGSEAATRSASA